jgi:hypothetical protein
MDNGGGGYEFRNSTSVIFISGVDTGQWVYVYFGTGAFLDIEALVISRGYKTYCNVLTRGPGGGTVTMAIPEGADAEYVSAAGAAVWSAGGPSSMASAYANPGHCCYTINGVSFRGLLVGNLEPSTHAGVYVGMVVGDAFQHQNTSISAPKDEVYFDPIVADGLRTNNTPKRKSWKEVPVTW